MKLFNLANISKYIVLIAAFSMLLFAPVTAQAQGLTPPAETNANFKCTGTAQECVDKNPITKWLQFFINLLSVVILAGSVIMIAVGGVQYTTSRDNPQAVQAAKQKIWNVVLALIVYFFLYSFIQWLVPGGVF